MPKKLTWIELEPTVQKNHKEKDSSLPKTRVVQTEEAEKVDKAHPDSYLGWQNQSVDKQTVSKNKNTKIGESQKLTSRPSESQDQKSDHKNQPNNGPKLLSKLGVPLLMPSEKKTEDTPQWATPGTRPEDYVEGIQESDRTALNTREYVFYGYFQRIRERLDKAWVPILREKLISYYKSGRHLANSTNHTTKVLVILNDKGEITRVQLVGESGTKDLDEAAVNAFNRAGPFPNPPKGMIDRNHEVKIPWDFVLKT